MDFLWVLTSGATNVSDDSMLELSEGNDESELILRESMVFLFMNESFEVGPVSKKSRVGMQKHFQTLVMERDRPLSLRENMTSSAGSRA